MTGLAERALAVLRANDSGDFFRPGALYPFQWNWDSALIALGLARVDPGRARKEVRSLLRGQWADGMVPHVVYHAPAPDYSPGPELWGCASAAGVPTSGITQPPVLATAVRALHEAAPDPEFLADVVPSLERWHRWLHAERGVDGLVAIVHPWEASDDSPRFDEALRRLAVDGSAPVRTDRRELAGDERPTDADYRRYLALVEWLRARDYRPSLDEAPFVYLDLTFNAIFAVAEEDLAVLWDELGGDGARAAAAATELRAALAGRSDGYETIDSLLPLYAGAADARRLYDEALWSPERFGPSADAPWAVTSTSKSSAAFDPRRYWRGPVWVNVNWFLVRGLERSGLVAEADELRRMTLELVERSGFAEYYDPRTGEPLGSRSFSWSAALTLDLLPASYDPLPTYPVVGGEVEEGWPEPPSELVVAIDGPPAVPWDELPFEGLDLRGSYAPWDEVVRRTAAFEIAGDPVFGRLFEGELREFFDALPAGGSRIVYGPGAALVPHDVLWYADVPKRQAHASRAPNLGQRDGPGSEQRLLFVDWPVLDRHKRRLLPSIDRYLDLGDAAHPRSLSGDALRSSLQALARRPFRARPTFLPGPWGGRWLLDELGVDEDAPNLAWSYELITPESSVLLDRLEVGFELLLAAGGRDLLGPAAHDRFGSSFPIRFDYLDTLGGGHLSIQCHPTDAYAREVFGLPYTQHESYYVMKTVPGATVFHGLRPGADVAAFRADAEAAAERGERFDPERYLEAHASEPHQLYLIPGGTPHASGAGNVVLEISATPYLYTLRFYDWLRRDLGGELRPVHLDHAFANLDGRRPSGPEPEPSVVRAGDGWEELALGSDPAIFFAVHRLEFERELEDDTRGRFHVLNLVEGEQIDVDGHPLAYGETLVVPAAVGRHVLRGGPAKVVKAFVP